MNIHANEGIFQVTDLLRIPRSVKKAVNISMFLLPVRLLSIRTVCSSPCSVCERSLYNGIPCVC